MKRIANGYYSETRNIGGHEWTVELVRIEGRREWYWHAESRELHKERGGEAWYPTKAEAQTQLNEAIISGELS